MSKTSLDFNYHISQAITPLDGRNKNKISVLSNYFSELALDRYRIRIELAYFKKLSEVKVIRALTLKEKALIGELIRSFGEKNYERIRLIEKKVNHDFKAVEEFIKEKLMMSSLKEIASMVHFGLTSDDTNNLAYGLMVQKCVKEVVIPELQKIENQLKQKVIDYKRVAMLARTHGQPAVPTTLGKELAVYYQRLKTEIEKLRDLEINGKLTGNTGNLNAHKFIFPKINWLKFSQEFVISLGLKPDLVTTQIEPYDSLISVFQKLLSINNILIGLSIDLWWYISLGYFSQKLIKSEVGSTALPHKINPIYFEGAEGGFGIANAVLEFYCRKLSYSRLQRDFSDSTVRRSIGIAFGYCLLSYQSIDEGLARIEANNDQIKQDLNRHLEVISEAIQSLLRIKNHKQAYEKTKEFFRGKVVSRESIKKFIKSLRLGREDEKKLTDLLPENYTGYAEALVDQFT